VIITKDSRRVAAKRNHGEKWDALCFRGRKSNTVLEGSQASLARPFGKSSMDVKTFYEVIAWERDSIIVISWLIHGKIDDLKRQRGDFDWFESGRLHEKHAVPTWNLRTISVFAWRQRKTKKTCVEMAYRRTFPVQGKEHLNSAIFSVSSYLQEITLHLCYKGQLVTVYTNNDCLLWEPRNPWAKCRVIERQSKLYTQLSLIYKGLNKQATLQTMRF
jgi:hypothetical protein